MQIEIGQQVNLKTGITIKVVGETNVNVDGRETHYLIGKLPIPKFVHDDTLTKFHLFDLYDIEGMEIEDIKATDD